MKIGGTRVFGYGVLVTSLLAILTPVAARYHVMALIAIRIFQGLFLVCIFYYLFCFNQSFRFWSLNPFPFEWVLRALIDFTLSNARRFYSSMGNLLDGKGLRVKKSQTRSKSIWLFLFLPVVALSSKQTKIWWDFLNMPFNAIICFNISKGINSSNFTKRDPEIMHFSGTYHAITKMKRKDFS